MTDDYCETQIWIGTQRLTCDRDANHDGMRGGVYPGKLEHSIRLLDVSMVRTLDVKIEWGDPM